MCPTLCNPMDYTARGILQARILELVAIPFSSGSSQQYWNIIHPLKRTNYSVFTGRCDHCHNQFDERFSSPRSIFRILLSRYQLPRWLSGKESACNARESGDMCSVPGLGRSPREGNGNSLQYTCLENSMERGASQATVQEVPELDMNKQLSMHWGTNLFLGSQPLFPFNISLISRQTLSYFLSKGFAYKSYK